MTASTTDFLDKIIEPISLSGIDGIISAGGALLGLSASQLRSQQVILAMLVILVADGSSMAASYFNMKTSSNEDENITLELIGRSLLNLVSFIVFGGIPVLVYVLTSKITRATSTALVFLSIVMTLSILGIVQWQMTGQVRLTYTTPIVGSIAGLLSFFVAPYFEKLSSKL